MVLLDGDKIAWHRVIDHEGDFINTLKSSVEEANLPENVKVIATGTEGRHLLNANGVVESICIEAALSNIGEKVDAVVSLGGEDFVVYTIDSEGKIITNFSGNKCASGTGEFFKQQLGRMNMTLDEIDGIPEDSQSHPLASRCSVFMKSDCTHKLNKGEATKGDIVLSLSKVMATKVVDFLNRAKIKTGRVLLSGGVTRNRFIVNYVKEMMPGVEFVVPESAPYFEALGAALIAQESGSKFPELETFVKSHEGSFGKYEQLSKAEKRVTYIEAKRDKIKADGEYILGIDGGSTTTKVVLIDIETSNIVASHYGRTHGDPVVALKNCVIELKKQIKEQTGAETVKVSIAATTGSSREILGVFLESRAVYNEIIAHAIGTTFYDENIDTIFEIGGQDAKYVYLNNKIPIDYAMNEACSAGTGSFIEESASGDLNIKNVWEIGDIAIAAENPLKFGEHCSAFINSDIRKGIQQGATREDITAGIITSIVSNYLNRVVGNRNIGQKIVLQGGVAKNKAVPMAFAALLDKDIIIPPDPELLGSFGVGILAKQKLEDGLLEKGNFNLDAIIESEIVNEREFTCKACENYCPIKVLNVNGNKYMFGGRCNKYSNSRKTSSDAAKKVFNYVDKREDLLFHECAPSYEDFNKKSELTVSIPQAFSVYTLWPMYSWFFHELGIEYTLADKISQEGVAKIESAYCFPAEIAHGTYQSAIDSKADLIFVPHFRDMPSYEEGTLANFCPITQSLPYYLKKAFPEVKDNAVLAPIISFQYGKEKALEGFYTMASQLGVSKSEISKAFDIAYDKQQEFHTKLKEAGQEALAKAREADHPVIAILGRPYNAFTKDANMGIPLKFTSRGYSVIPYDMLPFEGNKIFDNMYWYYGQEDMKTSVMLKKEDNIYLTWITNFSCAPDSFMLHYVKWIMGKKPFLVLELDSHSADAGIDTRVEAFLDIIDGYKQKFSEDKTERYDNGLRFINEGDDIHVKNIHTDKRIDIWNNKKITMLLSNMGQLSTELLAASVRGIGINAIAMPKPNTYTLQMARSYMSGKECLPSQLVLGATLSYFASEEYDKDQTYLLFVPTTQGPCRTGQYYVFYENLFRDLEIDNVVLITLDSDNSYAELGPKFTRNAWWGLIIADYMKDIETSLRTCAVNPRTAIAQYDELWKGLIEIAEKDISVVIPELKRIGSEIAKIPLKQKMEDTPKVLVVGEIYVRRDDFAVDELVRLFSKRGIIAKVSGISEWLYYCDHTRRHDLRKQYNLNSAIKKPFSKAFRELVVWKIEAMWKHNVEKKVKNALAVTNLIPTTPHDMDAIIENAEKHFVNQDLYSEISISSGVSATALEDDYSGVVNISPFACLIGRVIEGLITPWARDNGYPVMSLEVDGDFLPPNLINKLDIFMTNVLRLRSDAGIKELIELNEEEKVEEINR